MELRRGVELTPPDTTPTAAANAGEPPSGWRGVPWRTIVGTVGVVVATLATIALVLATARLILLIVVAGFFAIMLAPAVSWVQARVRDRRALATTIVMFSTAAVVIGLLVLIVLPVRHQAINVATDLPGTIDSAAQGDGPIGRAVTRLNLQSFVRDHQADLDRWADDLQGSSISIVRRAIGVLVTTITLFVLTFLFLSQSTVLGASAMSLVPPRRREAVRRAGTDAARAVSGYMLGNLLISLIAGAAAFVCLLLLGVPNPVVLALIIAFADLIPLVGATIGATLASFAAFLHSPTAGIVAVVFFVLYQQFENNVLQPLVMSRTVRVNPLVVIISVLVGVELFGFVGALLAIPVAGALQVAVRAARHEVRTEKLTLPDSVLRDLSSDLGADGDGGHR